MLAFKSDVSHWRKKNELTGVSIRYVFFSDMGFFTSIDHPMQNGVFRVFW
jgi:Cleft lip and palate transmembrane protein 1 (CLPTM1)